MVSLANAATPSRDNTPGKVAYRRNGKLFSCEPCRKGKLKCDHTSPVCGRCVRRGRMSDCVYHPAPLTKPRDTARVSPYTKDKRSLGLVSPPLDRADAQEVRQGDSFTRLSTLDKPPFSSRSPQEGLTVSSLGASIATSESNLSYRDSRHGFFGPTAFTAVFTEHSASTGFEQINTDNDTTPVPVPAERLEGGAGVLALLRDMPFLRKLTKRWFDHYDGLIIPPPVLKIWLDDLWEEWGALLTHGTHTQLLRLSELTFKNTRQPVRITRATTARQWAKSFTGRSIRWDVVGAILSLVGLVAANLSDWEAISDDMGERHMDRKEFIALMAKASEACLCFCYECEALSDAYVIFVFQDLLLLEDRKSEVHYACWQRMGELTDTAVALGIHRGNYVDDETPFWLSQLRRKLFVSIYSRDKVISSFLGRPPRLSIRYCKAEMPVELTDDDLFLEGAALDAALRKLDNNGWASVHSISRLRLVRAHFLQCVVREEILEIALGSDDSDLDAKIDRARTRLDSIHLDFPGSVRISAETVLTNLPFEGARGDRRRRNINAIYIVCINLGFQLTQFLLQRAVVNRGKEPTSTLIPISRTLLQSVLLIYSRRDIFGEFRGEVVWILVYAGLPSAGVLAVELLKQDQTRRHDPALPRSETIQDLSVFTAALATVSPDEGNYNICDQVRRALKRVLDQILMPSAPMLHSEPSIFDHDLYFPTGNDVDFVQWLDNIDWDRNLISTHPADVLQ